MLIVELRRSCLIPVGDQKMCLSLVSNSDSYKSTFGKTVKTFLHNFFNTFLLLAKSTSQIENRVGNLMLLILCRPSKKRTSDLCCSISESLGTAVGLAGESNHVVTCQTVHDGIDFLMSLRKWLTCKRECTCRYLGSIKASPV